jgi:dipeptidyl aminopeptidase/acylaminoacyl peptidase
MIKTSRIVLITLLQGALFAISAGVYPQQFENQDDVAWVHNKAKGTWDDSPRITLTFIEMFGDENDDNYLFYEPVAIAADKQGNIYVLDSKNFRVQVFDSDRKFLRSFGRRGQGPGDLGRPECIDLDDAGNVYVGDPGNGRIEVFDPSGVRLRSVRVGATNIVFRVMKNGDILLRSPNLDGGRGLKDGQVPLFRVLDSQGGLKRHVGQGIYFTKPPFTTGGNRALITADEQDNAYIAFLFQNRICKYSPEGRLVYAADRILPKDKLIDKDLGLYTTINSALDVDSRGRLWVVTHTRRWKKDELIMRQYVGGQEQLIGDRTETKTDLFEIQIFDRGGVLLQKVPLTHFCDYIKIIEDKLYILDKDRLGQFYVYQVKEM